MKEVASTRKEIPVSKLEVVQIVEEKQLRNAEELLFMQFDITSPGNIC